MYKRLAPRRMQHAYFLSSFFLLVCAPNSITIYDMRLSYFAYYASRAKALDLISWRTAADTACSAFACCANTCTHYRGADQQQQQKQPQGASASGSGSRLLRRQGGTGTSAEEGNKKQAERDNTREGALGDMAEDAPLQCLPALFLRCLQRGTAEHEKTHAQLKGRSSTLISRVISGLSSPAAEDAASPVAAAAAGLGAGRSGRSDSAGLEEGMLRALLGGGGGEEEPESRQTHQQYISMAYEDDCYAFFLFENTPLAVRVCDAFFRFCSLLLLRQRQRQQRSNICGDDASANGLFDPPSPCRRKPLVSCGVLDSMYLENQIF